MWICARCGETHEDDFDNCWNCGMSQDGTAELDLTKELDKEEVLYYNKKIYPKEKHISVPQVTLTTAPILEGHKVIEIMEIITSLE